GLEIRRDERKPARREERRRGGGMEQERGRLAPRDAARVERAPRNRGAAHDQIVAVALAADDRSEYFVVELESVEHAPPALAEREPLGGAGRLGAFPSGCHSAAALDSVLSRAPARGEKTPRGRGRRGRRERRVEETSAPGEALQIAEELRVRLRDAAG